MPVIQNQLPTLVNVIKLNGTEITEHGRTLSTSVDSNSADVMMTNGTKKRYIKSAKNTYSLSYFYLPSNTDKTVDGRVGRDYLISLMSYRGKILLSIDIDPDETPFQTYVYADSYSEELVRRDIKTDCSYYNVQVSFREA